MPTNLAMMRLGLEASDVPVTARHPVVRMMAATVRLAPIPAALGLALLEFTDLAAAGAAVERILQLKPSTCEMIDRTFIDLVRSGGEDPGYPLREGLEAILFVEIVGDSEDEVAARLAEVERAMQPVADRVSLALDAEQQERNFLMSVSHELRTPLTAIRGHVEALREGIAADPEAQAASLDMIARDGGRRHGRGIACGLELSLHRRG